MQDRGDRRARCSSTIASSAHLEGRARHRHRRRWPSTGLTDLQGKVVDRCLQLFGGYGYMDEYPISRIYRDARVQRIYAGTNEIMKLLIARSLCERSRKQPGERDDRRLHLRRRAHAARPRQGRRLAARGDGAQSRDARRSARSRTATSSIPRWSTTWCSAASIRSARRAATSRAPRRSWRATATSVPGVQINRFCASGLDAVNFAAAEVMSGQHDMTIGGGVESMSRVGMGASGGAWPMDPSIALPILFHAAGHFGRPDRHQIRLLARRRRRLCGREPEARGEGLGRGPLQELGDRR